MEIKIKASNHIVCEFDMFVVPEKSLEQDFTKVLRVTAYGTTHLETELDMAPTWHQRRPEAPWLMHPTMASQPGRPRAAPPAQGSPCTESAWPTAVVGRRS